MDMHIFVIFAFVEILQLFFKKMCTATWRDTVKYNTKMYFKFIYYIMHIIIIIFILFIICVYMYIFKTP